jgi:hypothetical protein
MGVLEGVQVAIDNSHRDGVVGTAASFASLRLLSRIEP